MLCPDFTPESKKLFTVQNFYNNLKQRVSFSIDVAKCNNYENNRGCKGDDETRKLFESMYFQLIVVA